MRTILICWIISASNTSASGTKTILESYRKSLFTKCYFVVWFLLLVSLDIICFRKTPVLSPWIVCHAAQSWALCWAWNFEGSCPTGLCVSDKMVLGRTQRGEHEEDEDEKGRRRGTKRGKKEDGKRRAKKKNRGWWSRRIKKKNMGGDKFRKDGDKSEEDKQRKMKK